MKNIILPVVLFFSILFSACSPATPEQYFDIAVLNCNFLIGFANTGQIRELESPSMKMSEKGGEPVMMERREVITGKIQFVEKTLAKLRRLEMTDETKELLEASLALYHHVLPVYRNEYLQLAMLYDTRSPKEKITEKAELIQKKYYPRYEQLHTRLINAGKSYAKKHKIEVNWMM